jgi:hypothetical protein
MVDRNVQLAEYVAAVEGRLFVWSQHDCCQWCAGWVALRTGRDPREIFPQYSNESEALAIIEECGGLEGLITKALGPPMENKAFAQRGDIVLCDFGSGPQPGICIGVHCVAPGAKGFVPRMTDSALAAWKVD